MNETAYAELLKRRPFGWDFEDPQVFSSYSFERIDPFMWHTWLEDNWQLSYYAAAIYLFTIFGLQRYMKDRVPFDLKGPLFFWNLGLGIFSWIGFARTAPELLYVLYQPNGFFDSVCTKKRSHVPIMFWGLMFAMSKFVELGDTVFIVLRKRPLQFLQWYHHIATLLVVWAVAPLVEPIGRWYGVLNFGVHSLMYPYFAAKTIGIHVPEKISKLITTLQLAQMIVGFGVNMISLLFLGNGFSCARYPISIKSFNLVYGSFIFLFGKLFYDSVVKSKREKKKIS